MNLKELILDAMQTDEVPSDRISRIVSRKYREASKLEKIKLNDIFIDLTGYSLDTLITKSEGQNEDF